MLSEAVLGVIILFFCVCVCMCSAFSTFLTAVNISIGVVYVQEVGL